MKKQLLLILGLMFTATLFAAPVTKESAKKNVLSFLQSKKGTRMYAAAGQKQAQLTQVDYAASNDAFYVFNIGNNEGFVITAADDRVEPILGYSYEGSFDPNNVPVNMKNWLKIYSEQIGAVKNLNINTVSRKFDNGSKKPYRHSIPAMITTKWDQSSPYNDMAPNLGYEVFTGCVATAMAQVMNFHEWPKDQVGAIPAYQFYDSPQLGGDGTYKDVEGVGPTTFNWDLMEDEYNYNSTQESKHEVAKLMRYCGQSLNMGYHPYASGAFTFDLPEALRKYFNYDKGAKYLDKDGILTYEWEDIVYDELLNNRPVLYSGATEGAGGHQFICDGYENEYFHFNWGWGGVSDGYFKLTCLDPDQEGQIGGNGMDFSDSQQIVIGVQPPVEGTVQPENYLEIGSLQLTKNFDGEFTKSNLGKVTISVRAVYGIHSERNLNTTVGFGLYSADNKLIEVSFTKAHQFFTGGYFKDKVITAPVTLSPKAIEKDGTYYLRPVVKNAKGDFEVVTSGDRRYFEVVVSGNNVKVTTYPVANVAFTNVRVDGPVYTQCKSSIYATIENLGDTFDGVLYLTVDGKVESTNQVAIVMRKGETKEVKIPFVTFDNKKQKFGLSVNGVYNSPEVEVDVQQGVTRGAAIEIAPAKDITSDGNYFDIPVEITNGKDYNYKAPIGAVLMLKSGNTYREVKTVYVPVEVLKGEKTNVNVHFEGLEFNKIYHLAFTYYSYGQEKMFGGVNQQGVPLKVFSKYRTADALSYYDTEGNMNYKVIASGETYEIPANACYVRVPKTISGRTIIPSANKNCIYSILPGVSSSMFANCNIFKNGGCVDMKLSDAYEFYYPEPILVNTVNLTIAVENSMNTILLPFAPSRVTCDGVELTRANSVEEFASKDFALLPIVAEDATTVYCDFDDTYGVAPSVLVVKKELVGKSLVFYAEDLNVDLRTKFVRGDNFIIHSSNKTTAFEEPIFGYGVKEFSKNIKTAKPFSLYLTSTLASDAEKVNIVYPEGLLETGIDEIDADMNGKMVDVYTVDGVKVKTAQYGDKMLEGLPSGLYIVNGKKFVK